MTLTIKPSQFRQLEATRSKITNIYPEYRYGWDDVQKRNRTFIHVPASVTASLIKKGDPSLNLEGVTEKKLMEQIYDKAQGGFMLKNVDEKINAAFFKLFKKVFDIELQLESHIKLTWIWNPEEKKEVEYDTDSWETIRVRAFASSKIQKLAKAMMLTKGIQKVEMLKRDRTTWVEKKEMDLPYNWEDSVLPAMIGKCFEFAVDGSWLDTEYTFREVGEIKIQEPIAIEDIPF